MRLPALVTGLSLLAIASLARAEPSSLLRSENRRVREGNEKLAAGDAKGALAAYDRAARELPSEGGVHLNRGLALLRSGNLPAAREALRLASQPPAGSSVRADAHYDLGVAFYREADEHAGKDEHEQAQKLFREAADAFKRALRQRPGDRNAAWNYELAERRVQEQKQKQQEQEQKNQDPQNQDPQNQDPQNQDPQNQDPQNQDPQKDQSQKSPEPKKDDKKEEQAQKQPQPDKGKQDPQEDKEPQPEPGQAQEQERPLRPDVAQALDALQDGEENLERLRAMQRAARERRTPEKDW